MKKILIFIIAALTDVARADAGSVQRGGVCFTHHVSIDDANVVWNCEHLGRVTVKKIYEKGFRVVGAYVTDPANKTFQTQYLVIEQQRG